MFVFLVTFILLLSLSKCKNYYHVTCQHTDCSGTNMTFSSAENWCRDNTDEGYLASVESEHQLNVLNNLCEV